MLLCLLSWLLLDWLRQLRLLHWRLWSGHWLLLLRLALCRLRSLLG